MVELSFLDRLRDFLRSRRFLWIVTILLGSFVVIYFLFVSFLFDPFENDLEDLATVVPRDVDYFFRWQGMAQRFADFPEPSIWSQIEDSAVYEDLEASGDLTRIAAENGIDRVVADLREAAAGLPGMVDLKTDLLREFGMAGRGHPELDSRFDGVIFLRVSFKVKAAVALLNFDFIRSKLPEGFEPVSEGDGRYRLPQFPAFGGQDAWLARTRDVVMLASREEWLDAAYDLEIRSGEGSLAPASKFYDNVSAHLTAGAQPLEFYMNREAALGRIDWPAPQAGYFIELLSRFVDPNLTRDIAGYWLPGVRFQGRLAGSLDLTQGSEFHKRWYGSSPLKLRQLEEVAGMIPAESFFFGAVSGDPSRVFQEFFGALEDESRRLIDEVIVESSGEFQGAAHLLTEMGAILSPGGLFLALRRNDYPPADGDPDHDDRPAPLFMFVGVLRPGSENDGYERFLDFFTENARKLARGADQPPRTERVTLRTGEELIAFASPAIPGTGEIVTLKYQLPGGAVAIVSNSSKLVAQALDTRAERTGSGVKLSEREGFQRTLAVAERSGANMLAYVDPAEARPWLERLAAQQARDDFQQRMSNANRNRRPEVEAELRQQLFGGRTDLTELEQGRLREEVDAVMEQGETEAEREQIDGIRAALERRMLPLQWLEWASLVLRAGDRNAAVILSGELNLD